MNDFDSTGNKRKDLLTIDLIERELKRIGRGATVTKVPNSRIATPESLAELENIQEQLLAEKNQVRVKSLYKNRMN